MVRETRHLWVGNLPENIREDRIRDHFKRYGRVQSVKLLGRKEDDGGGGCATVSFMDIKSAAKAHHSDQKLEDRILTTEYHEPPSIPSTNSQIHYSSRYGSGEEVVSFERTAHFYDGGREGRDYLRTRYEPLRSRRDSRIYRNGPYSALIGSTTERSRSDHHGRGWGGYESPRYSTTLPSSQDISPYPEERRDSSLHSKKHSKSRSGSESGASSGSSRSSSASSQSSSCSSASSSPTSEKSCSTHSCSPAVHNEDRRPLAICVRNLPARSSDTSLKDGLYHEYKKHGKVTWVKVVGQGSERYAVVCFKKTEDVDKALQVSHDKLFFGCKIDVAPYQGYDIDDNEFSFVSRPFEADQDEFHPKATRTLFIGNLEKDISLQEIRKHFDQFGEILDIDIKKQGTSSSYAFCQYTDIASVVRAIRSLDGEHLGSTRIKLGFGKSLHTNCVWVDGISEAVSEKYLSQIFGQFGPVSHVVIDRSRGQALISFEQIAYAQQAVKEMRGLVFRGRKLQIDYASRECQEAFYDHMDKQSTSHPSYETSVQASPQNTVASNAVRGFETPSSSSSSSGGGGGSRYTQGRYPPTQPTQRYHTSPSTPRTPRQRYDYPSSEHPHDRRSSYRSYDDVISVEESGGHKEGEECPSSGEEGVGRRKCKHRRSEGEGSRPGTPLCDERPEPTEPRRVPRERPQDPLSLPLPRFASQVLPPPSPPSSDDSQPSPPSPEWEERLRSLDEKYQKWSGSRSNPTKPDPSSLRQRPRFLDPHELQPSEIVKSLLAKRSVFDEDLKRLENFGEKYEPKEFVAGRTLRSPGSPAAVKGLQYPFPTHPVWPFPSPTQEKLAKPKPKVEKTEIKKDITSSLLLSSIKPAKPLRRDSEPSEVRRKSREEVPEMVKTLESVVKKDDTSECDKVKDAQVSERRKSTADKRRSSIDLVCKETVDSDKVKDINSEKRRQSCDSIESDSKPKIDSKKHIPEVTEQIVPSEVAKRLEPECRKDLDVSIKNPSTADVDRKKDIFGVNSEKDRRRKDSLDSSIDNPKHKKVPDFTKSDMLVKNDSEEIRPTESDKRKEESKSKDRKEVERRRDSGEDSSKPKLQKEETNKFKDLNKKNETINEYSKSKKEVESDNVDIKKDVDKDIKPKEEKKKNCETNEISKEHCLFKKVFGFPESLRKENKKDSCSNPFKQEQDKAKEKRDQSLDKKKDDCEGRLKTNLRKSPETPDVKHKDLDKRRNNEVSDKKKKESEMDNFISKEYDVSMNYHKRKAIERCLSKDGVSNDIEHIIKTNDYKKNDEVEDGAKCKENDRYSDLHNKENKKKEITDLKIDKRNNLDYENERYFESDGKKGDDVDKLKEKLEVDTHKLKHSEKSKDDKKKHSDFIENCKFKDDRRKEDNDRHKRKDIEFESTKLKDENIKSNDRKKDFDTYESIRRSEDKKKDHYENNRFRDMDEAFRKRKDLESLERSKDSSERKKDLLEKERRRDRELVDAKYRDSDDKKKDKETEKPRKNKEEGHETKINGDHVDSIFDAIDETEHKLELSKKEKKKEHRLNSWPAAIGNKRRLSSQDSDMMDESKRTKQERRDSKDSTKSSGSSKKGEKHNKSFSKSLEERIKEEKDHDFKKKDENSESQMVDDKGRKQSAKKEKKNSERKKEEKKFKSRPKENGTASESDLGSGDEEVKNLKKQYSIFDIVDDEPAYISMYDKVKARSTKNMQKQEEEKRQEKLKEKFSQLKQCRAKREEKKRSTSYDEDSDSERGQGRRSNKHLITSSDDDHISESEIKLKNRKLLYDTSEDDTMIATPKPKSIRTHAVEHESKVRKILSDTSEDDLLRHSTPKIKPRSLAVDLEVKSRKIMSDTSEDDTLRKNISRLKTSRIQSDDSENDVLHYSESVKEMNKISSNSLNDESYREKCQVIVNHSSHDNNDHEVSARPLSPENYRRNSFEMSLNDIYRKKKKQKKQKHFDDNDGLSSKKHSSKKEKKKSHIKDEEENCKKSRKKKDKENNKREDKMEDIFGPLSDDSDKGINKWHVNQVYGSDTDSEHENIRKKEKRRREKKARELDEAGRALEANLMDNSEENYPTTLEPVKNKKKKRKKSRDEKIKHHSQKLDDDHRIEGDSIKSYRERYEEYSRKKQDDIKERPLGEKDHEIYSSDKIDEKLESMFKEDEDQRLEEEQINLHSRIEDDKQRRLRYEEEKDQRLRDEDNHKFIHSDDEKLSVHQENVDQSFKVEEKYHRFEDDKPHRLKVEDDKMHSLLKRKEDDKIAHEDKSQKEPDENTTTVKKEIDKHHHLSMEKDKRRIEEEAVESILPHKIENEDPLTSKFKQSSLLETQASTQVKKSIFLEDNEDIHEKAIKSISEPVDIKIDSKFEQTKIENPTNEDKPTPTISQEETEDAVAALLMDDPFGGSSGEFEGYEDDVQKPETPASEPDLQIDTDTEDNYDSSIDISKPPKTPDIPQSFYRQQSDTREGLEERIMSLACPSDTPTKDDIKLLEIPRTPGSGLEKKDETPNPDILSVKVNFDKSNKFDSTSCDIPCSPKVETPNDLDDKQSEKNVEDKTIELKNDTPSPKEEKPEEINTSNLNDKTVSRFTPQDHSPLTIKASVESPKDLATSHLPTIISAVSESYKVEKPSASPIISNPVIKEGDKILLSPLGHSVKLVSTKALEGSIANVQNVEPLKVNMAGSNLLPKMNSPTTVVVGPNSPVRSIHLQPVVHSNLVRSHQTSQVHHLTVIPQLRSPGSPQLHGVTPKPATQVIQQPPVNPIIRHAFSPNLQQMKPTVAAAVTQPNVQRQLHIVTHSSQLSPRQEQPNSPINIVRLVRPATPRHGIPLLQTVNSTSTIQMMNVTERSQAQPMNLSDNQMDHTSSLTPPGASLPKANHSPLPSQIICSPTPLPGQRNINTSGLQIVNTSSPLRVNTPPVTPISVSSPTAVPLQKVNPPSISVNSPTAVPHHKVNNPSISVNSPTVVPLQKVSPPSISVNSPTAVPHQKVSPPSISVNSPTAVPHQKVNNPSISVNSPTAVPHQKVNNPSISVNSPTAVPHQKVNNPSISVNSPTAVPHQKVNNPSISVNSPTAVPLQKVNTPSSSPLQKLNSPGTAQVHTVSLPSSTPIKINNASHKLNSPTMLQKVSSPLTVEASSVASTINSTPTAALHLHVLNSPSVQKNQPLPPTTPKSTTTMQSFSNIHDNNVGMSLIPINMGEKPILPPLQEVKASPDDTSLPNLEQSSCISPESKLVVPISTPVNVITVSSTSTVSKEPDNSNLLSPEKQLSCNSPSLPEPDGSISLNEKVNVELVKHNDSKSEDMKPLNTLTTNSISVGLSKELASEDDVPDKQKKIDQVVKELQQRIMANEIKEISPKPDPVVKNEAPENQGEKIDPVSTDIDKVLDSQEKSERPVTPNEMKDEIKDEPPDVIETETKEDVLKMETESPPQKEPLPEKGKPSRRGRKKRGGMSRDSGVGARKSRLNTAAPVTTVTDVYEFRDDSEEERPRLILTIKSPPETKPTPRKSRRLQEKDGVGGKVVAVEETIEEVVKGRRRATRSTQPNLTVQMNPEPRKSPRRKQKADDKPLKESPPAVANTTQPAPPPPEPTPSPPPIPQSVPSAPTPVPPTTTATTTTTTITPVSTHVTAPVTTTTTTAIPSVQTQIVNSNNKNCLEPTTLIDPVTGLLIPMQESEEGQYIPLHAEQNRAEGEPAEKRLRIQTDSTRPSVVKQTTPGPVTPSVPVQSVAAPKSVVTANIAPVSNPVTTTPTIISHPVKVVASIASPLPLTSSPTKVVVSEPISVVKPVSVVKPTIPSSHPVLQNMVISSHSVVQTTGSATHTPIVHPATTAPLHHQAMKPVVPHPPRIPPAAHTPVGVHSLHGDVVRAAPSPAPRASPGLPVPCKPPPINPKARLLQAVRSTPAPPAHSQSKPHIHQAITTMRDDSIPGSPPLRAAHQQLTTHPSPTSPRVVVKPGIESVGDGSGCIVVPSPSPQPRPPISYEPSMGESVQHYVHYVHSQLMYQQYLRGGPAAQTPQTNYRQTDIQPMKDEASSPPLELRKPVPPRPSVFYENPPPAHYRIHTPPAQGPPPPPDSLLMLLQRHPLVWQGLLILKNDQTAVQMHFVNGNPLIARDSLPCNIDGSTPPLRIFQRMRLEPAQIDGVSRKMQAEKEHCMLLALPCGRNHLDVLQQSFKLRDCFIPYLQQKQAAGIINIPDYGSREPAYVMHIFPACDFANDNLARVAPNLLYRVADFPHLLIVITTV